MAFVLHVIHKHCQKIIQRQNSTFLILFLNTNFVSSHMYPENPEGTQVIVGSNFTNVLTPDFTYAVQKRVPGPINGNRDPKCTIVVEQKEDSVNGRQVVS